MIINKSGITIRLNVENVRVMGRATQGVRLINLDRNDDQIGSVCKVTSEKLENEGVILDEDAEDVSNENTEELNESNEKETE